MATPNIMSIEEAQRIEACRMAAVAAAERQRLRDQFAAAALTGLLSLNRPGPGQRDPVEVCRLAYDWGDLMVRQRPEGNR